MPSALTAKRVGIADRATNAQRATNADNALGARRHRRSGLHDVRDARDPVGHHGDRGLRGRQRRHRDQHVPANSPSTDTLTTTYANDVQQVVQLPGPAPTELANGSVNFAPSADAADADAACAGTAVAPSAPAGKVCLYLSAAAGTDTMVDGEAIPGLAGSRLGFVVHAVSATTA